MRRRGGSRRGGGRSEFLHSFALHGVAVARDKARDRRGRRGDEGKSILSVATPKLVLRVMERGWRHDLRQEGTHGGQRCQRSGVGEGTELGEETIHF